MASEALACCLAVLTWSSHSRSILLQLVAGERIEATFGASLGLSTLVSVCVDDCPMYCSG